MESVHVFGNAPIYYFGIAELSLDILKRMLHFASDRRLPVLDLLIPVESSVAGGDLQAGWPDVCPEFDVTEVFMILYFQPLCCTTIARVSIAYFIILAQEINGFVANFSSEGYLFRRNKATITG